MQPLVPLFDFYTAGIIYIAGSSAGEGLDDGPDDVYYTVAARTVTAGFDTAADWLAAAIDELRDDPDYDFAYSIELGKVRSSLPADPPSTDDAAEDYADTYTWHGLVWQGLAARRYWFLLHHPLTPEPVTGGDPGHQWGPEMVVAEQLSAETGWLAGLRAEAANERPRLDGPRLRAECRRAGLVLPAWLGADGD